MYEALRSVYPDYEKMTREELLEAFDNELSDLLAMSKNTTAVFSELTRGQVSKPLTDASVVLDIVQEFQNQDIQQAIADDRLIAQMSTLS